MEQEHGPLTQFASHLQHVAERLCAGVALEPADDPGSVPDDREHLSSERAVGDTRLVCSRRREESLELLAELGTLSASSAMSCGSHVRALVTMLMQPAS